MQVRLREEHERLIKKIRRNKRSHCHIKMRSYFELKRESEREREGEREREEEKKEKKKMQRKNDRENKK